MTLDPKAKLSPWEFERRLAEYGLDRTGRTATDPSPRVVEGADMSYLVNVIRKGTETETRQAVAKLHNDVILLQNAFIDAVASRSSAIVEEPMPDWWKGDAETFRLCYNATPEQIETSLQSQRDKLSNLPENWDGYGAHPLPASIIDDLLSEITVEGGVVDIVPGGDGSIQAEWHRCGSIDIEYQIAPDGKRSLYVKVSRALNAALTVEPEAPTRAEKSAE